VKVFVFLWIIVAGLCPCVVAAQQPNASGIDQLRSAFETMRRINGYFLAQIREQKATDPVERDLSKAYADFREATINFTRSAPNAFTDEAMTRVRTVFQHRNIPVPKTLRDVVEDCQRRGDVHLSADVTSQLLGVFGSTWEEVAAEAKFGPIAENPDFYSKIKPPRDGLDLPNNIHWAIEHDVVLRDDFYTLENMQRFFGVRGQRQRYLNGSIGLNGSFEGGESAIEKMDPSLKPYAHCGAIVGRTLTSEVAIHGAIKLSCNFKQPMMPTFADIEDVFGTGWQDGLKVFGSPIHGPPPPRTAPHGNEVMVYTLGSPSAQPTGRPLKRSLVVRFGPDGSLSEFDFNAEN
jgi:hypothetical protein